MGSRRVAFTLLQCWQRVPGGTASSILSLADAISRTGEVDLIGVGPWGRGLPPDPWRPSVPVGRLPLPNRLVYDCWHRLGWPSVQMATGPVDVVHATTITVPPARKRPLVVTIHDVFPLLAPAQFNKRGVRLLTRGVEIARRHADLVLCPSEATLDDCIADGFEAERVRVVPWGVEPIEVSDEDRARVRARYGLDRRYVLWVGNMEPRKNLPTLLEAFRRLDRPEVDLVLAGPIGAPGLVEAHLSGIERLVNHLGFVPAADLPALYAEAALLCLPSLREGFGLPALEAMSHATPVIASSGTAVAEVVGQTGILAHPTKITEWVESMRTVLDDEALATQLGQEGRARSAIFTWERAAAATIQAYEDVSG